jgi:phospholipid/cholesterol/gamma-HCH transport system substrate-binding protein
MMRLRGLLIVGLTLLVAFIAVGGRGDDGYEVVVQMDDALGLRDGSKVVTGGVEIGRVDVELGEGDQVKATLKIDDEHAPIGRGAKAFVTSVNLLGQKNLELDPGDKTSPMPSGGVIPARRVTPSTDLDQVLNVLDDNTRARLTVMVNEAGSAFAGRRLDVASFLRELPSSLTQGTAMLDRLVADGRTLGSLVRKSDTFVARLARERRSLADLLDAAGRGAETAATKRAELRTTLQRLPGTLASARAFLADLRDTTVPLGPAARQLSATARPLSQTLEALTPFTRAATPALAQARAVAPRLTRLADGATPVLRRTRPRLEQLAEFSSALVPVTNTLDKSADNIVATVANWAHAIQFRDSLSHVFRAEVSVSPASLNYFVDRLKPPAEKRRASRKSGSRPRPSTKPSAPSIPALPRPRLPDAVGKLPDAVKKALGDVVKGLSDATNPKDARPKPAEHLLDFLLHP